MLPEPKVQATRSGSVPPWRKPWRFALARVALARSAHIGTPRDQRAAPMFARCRRKPPDRIPCRRDENHGGVDGLAWLPTETGSWNQSAVPIFAAAPIGVRAAVAKDPGNGGTDSDRCG